MAAADEVIVIGGGIGGLTAALALHAQGMPCRVFESVPEIKALGVGINLLPHSTRVLCGLGLREAMEESAILTAELRYHSQDGKEIWVEPRGIAAGYPFPQYSVHRGHLQSILLDAVKQRLGSDSVVVDHHFVALEQNDSEVVVHFQSKKSGEDRGKYRAKLVVGADGLMSRVRASFYPDEGPPKFNGLMLWRGIVEAEPFLSGRSMVMAGHNTLKAVVYPISAEAARRGRSLINWVAERRVGMDYQHRREDWDRRGEKRDFVEHFRDWDFGWLNFPRLLEATETVYEFPMVDRDPLPQWTFGRVTLLGDAAHAMYPNGSNGASQAILDAEALALSLAENRGSDGLAAYEARRRGPTSQLVLDNRQTGPERVMQLVADRCDGRCVAVHTCVPKEELAEIAQRYKKLAGFDKETVSKAKMMPTNG